LLATASCLSPVQNVLTFIIVLPWAVTFPLWVINTFFVVLFPRSVRWVRAKWEGRQIPSGRMGENVWTIHGRRYDLSAFQDQHPGGPWALQLGRNRDCTGLFESYHVFSDMAKLQKIMARYELPESKNQALSASPWADPTMNPTGLVFRDAFHEDVKKMAQDFFKERGYSHKVKPWVFVCTLIVIAAEIVAAIMLLQGYRVALVLLPLCGSLLFFNVAHEASHFAFSSRPFVNALFACTSAPMSSNSTGWYIQHIVQHHVYTNDEHDVDLYHFLPVTRTTRFTEHCNQFRLQCLSIWIALPTSVAHLLFVVPMDLLTGHIDPFTKRRRYDECENIEDLVAGTREFLILEFLLSWVFPFALIFCHGFVKGFCWIAIAYSLSSGFFILATQGAHLQEECQEFPEDKSWAKRQVMTSLCFSPDSWFWSYATGGLNMQALHHILPCVSASHLRDMYPTFREVCRKHKVQLKEVDGMCSFFGGFLHWVKTLGDYDAKLDKISSGKDA